jgi:hypothetical protein
MQKIFCALFLCSQIALGSILPPNKLHLETQTNASDMTKEQFERIIDEIAVIYAPEVAKHGAKLIMNKLWDNQTVNANANQSGLEWHVNMYGGLARRNEVTPDGFALVVCHELGHHLGGFPFYGESWPASEGQSDFWATQVCGKRYFGKALSEENYEVDPIVDQKCGQDALCKRLAFAGKSLAHLLSALRNGPVPDFGTPNKTVVATTLTSHPEAQCRLDTYFAGALCAAKSRLGFIPGKFNPNGQLSKFAQFEALGSSCDSRPRCWYAAL